METDLEHNHREEPVWVGSLHQDCGLLSPKIFSRKNSQWFGPAKFVHHKVKTCFKVKTVQHAFINCVIKRGVSTCNSCMARSASGLVTNWTKPQAFPGGTLVYTMLPYCENIIRKSSSVTVWARPPMNKVVFDGSASDENVEGAGWYPDPCDHHYAQKKVYCSRHLLYNIVSIPIFVHLEAITLHNTAMLAPLRCCETPSTYHAITRLLGCGTWHTYGSIAYNLPIHFSQGTVSFSFIRKADKPKALGSLWKWILDNLKLKTKLLHSRSVNVSRYPCQS